MAMARLQQLNLGRWGSGQKPTEAELQGMINKGNCAN
jgi:hypothetical protein